MFKIDDHLVVDATQSFVRGTRDFFLFTFKRRSVYLIVQINKSFYYLIIIAVCINFFYM